MLIWVKMTSCVTRMFTNAADQASLGRKNVGHGFIVVLLSTVLLSMVFLSTILLIQFHFAGNLRVF